MKPLILNFITQRTNTENDICYEYDYCSSLNVITVENKRIPLIDANSKILNIRTETKVQQESSDAGFSFIKKKTITRVLRESTQDPYICLMELKSKTLVSRERDDESFINIQ